MGVTSAHPAALPWLLDARDRLNGLRPGRQNGPRLLHSQDWPRAPCCSSPARGRRGTDENPAKLPLGPPEHPGCLSGREGLRFAQVTHEDRAAYDSSKARLSRRLSEARSCSSRLVQGQQNSRARGSSPPTGALPAAPD